MTATLRETITEERIGSYRRRMEQNHATPFLCVGVGHSPGPEEGQFVVCVTEDQDLAQLALILRQLLADLEHTIGAN